MLSDDGDQFIVMEWPGEGTSRPFHARTETDRPSSDPFVIDCFNVYVSAIWCQASPVASESLRIKN
jgi:hypothetical protein